MLRFFDKPSFNLVLQRKNMVQGSRSDISMAQAQAETWRGKRGRGRGHIQRTVGESLGIHSGVCVCVCVCVAAVGEEPFASPSSISITVSFASILRIKETGTCGYIDNHSTIPKTRSPLTTIRLNFISLVLNPVTLAVVVMLRIA